jgi:hypothetical protein
MTTTARRRIVNTAPFEAMISVGEPRDGGLPVHFVLPPGNEPLDSRHWVALYVVSEQQSIDLEQPVASMEVSEKGRQGAFVLECELESGVPYLMAYHMDPEDPRSICATFRFKITE